MTLRKISLLITLLLSMCFVYAQSEIDIEIINDTDTNDYVCVVTFNQSVTPNTPISSPVSFTVQANTTYEAHYEFDVDDVNVESVRCAYVGGGQVGTISVAYGFISVDVAPEIAPSIFHHFIFDDYDGQDEWEWLKFIIEE